MIRKQAAHGFVAGPVGALVQLYGIEAARFGCLRCRTLRSAIAGREWVVCFVCRRRLLVR